MKKTKILCTVGPASNDRRTLKRMFDAGMNAVRLNTAFGTIREYVETMRAAWSVDDIPVLLDIKGPEIRLKCREPSKIPAGGTLKLGFKGSDPVRLNRRIYGQLQVGDAILLNKGKVRTTVIGKKGGHIRIRFKDDCTLKDGGGVNIPGRRLEIPTLSKQDLDVIRMGKRLGADYVALSFTRNVDDVRNLKKELKGTKIGVIAKIENQEGVDNAYHILRECDGVMVARGDLGIEIPPERIPWIQKELIGKCNRMGKISIVATEMLHTMIENPEPTRAETSDVANAILDGADVIMLSGESAIGKYPVEAVKTMSRIAVEVERHLPIKPLDEEIHHKIPLAISKAVTAVIETVDVDKIVVATHTGYTAMLISNFRINKDIIAITDDPTTKRKLHMVYAIQPVEHAYFKNKERVLEIAKYCYKEGLIKKDDLVLFTAGVYTHKPTTNLVEIHRVSELLRYAVRRDTTCPPGKK